MTKTFQDRTDSKLRFANLLLNELLTSGHLGSGDDYEISYEESCLYHIIGAKDAFLQELNLAYNLNLSLKLVSERNIQNKLKDRSGNYESFNVLKNLEDDSESWLAMIIEYRNHGTHRDRIPRSIYVKMNISRESSFNFPPIADGKPLDQNIPDYLKSSIENMRDLIQELRELI